MNCERRRNYGCTIRYTTSIITKYTEHDVFRLLYESWQAASYKNATPRMGGLVYLETRGKLRIFFPPEDKYRVRTGALFPLRTNERMKHVRELLKGSVWLLRPPG